MANHQVTITLVNGRHAVPMPGRLVMNVGDTVQYDTDPPDRDFKVEFIGSPSPFTPQVAFTITDRNQHELLTAGRFFCRCFIMTPEGLVGWEPDEEPMESGGDHDIRPRRG